MKYVLIITAAAALAATGALAAHHEMKPDDAAMNAKMEAHFKEVDANGDGKITEKELVKFATAKAKSEFAAMAGDDGAVGIDEMRAHHMAKHKEMMKGRSCMGQDESEDAGEGEPEHAEQH